jgi:hypothetical protein
MARVTITRQDTGEALEIDTAPSVDVSRSWSVTANPVERGAAVTDHTQPLPAEMQITGIITGIDVQGAGRYGAAKYEWLQAWVIAGYASLWDVVVPGRPGLTNCLVTACQIGMTMDDFLSITIGVREVRLVDAQTAGALIGASAGGATKGRVPAGKPPPKTDPDLATTAEDGAQPTESGGLLYQGSVFLGIIPAG